METSLTVIWGWCIEYIWDQEPGSWSMSVTRKRWCRYYRPRRWLPKDDGVSSWPMWKEDQQWSWQQPDLLYIFQACISAFEAVENVLLDVPATTHTTKHTWQSKELLNWERFCKHRFLVVNAKSPLQLSDFLPCHLHTTATISSYGKHRSTKHCRSTSQPY